MTFHTVYLSYESGDIGRDYIGKHTSADPYDCYKGSFRDETFQPDSKIILEYATTEEGAILAEIRWQKVFQVAENETFANQSYQTSTGFKSVAWSEERKKHQSTLMKGPGNPMRGRFGESNPFFGKTHTPKNIELLSKLAKEQAKDPEWLKKTSKKGKKEKEATREKKRKVVRGNWWTSPEGDLKRSETCPGEGWEKRRGGVGFWWVNPENETCQSDTQPGPLWVRGRKWREQ